MFLNYIKKLLIFAFLYGAIVLGILSFVFPFYLSFFFGILLAFFTIVAAISHYILLRKHKSKSANFPMVLMGVTSAKLLLYIGTVCILLLGWKMYMKSIIVIFAALYIGFAIFETYQMQKISKSKS